MQLKLDKHLTLSPQFSPKLVMDWFQTGTNEFHVLHTVMVMDQLYAVSGKVLLQQNG